jgi:hypothetical protein
METISKSEFDARMIRAIEREDMTGTHGLQALVMASFCVQLEFNYEN